MSIARDQIETSPAGMNNFDFRALKENFHTFEKEKLFSNAHLAPIAVPSSPETAAPT